VPFLILDGRPARILLFAIACLWLHPCFPIAPIRAIETFVSWKWHRCNLVVYAGLLRKRLRTIFLPPFEKGRRRGF